MFSWLLGIVFPLRCLGCQRYDDWLCPDCVATLTPTYQHPLLKSSIHAMKYGGHKGIANVLGLYLANRTDPHSYDLVVPVPLHWRRRLERGYNQSAELAKQFPKPWLPALRKCRHTDRQAALNRFDRLRNLQGAFIVPAHYRRVIQGKRILLVDDVYSTGATTAACAEALTAAGAASVIVAAVALNVPSCGIEPQLQEPQSCVLSVERRGPDFAKVTSGKPESLVGKKLK